MSCNSVSDNITKKCGDVIIAIKKNAKNVYSFNCWFCGTIYVQIKKFTLHIEQEHITQLKQTASDNSEDSIISIIEKNNQKPASTTSNLFEGEIKNNHDIKSVIVEEEPQIRETHHLSRTRIFQDPLKECDTEIGLPYLQNEEVKFNKKESILDDEEIQIFSANYDDDDDEDDDDDDHNDDDNDDDENLERNSNSFIPKTSNSDTKIVSCSDKKLPKVFKEKKFIITLIESYFERPQLWNPSLSKNTSIKQRKALFQSITDNLNVKLNLNLKYYTVKKKLNFLCQQYEKEIRKTRREGSSYNDKGCSDLWYYENLTFLKSTVESKLKQKRKKVKEQPLSEDVLCKIIVIYKNYNSLWDVNNIAYTVTQKRNETMQSMVDNINTKLNLSLTLDKLKSSLQFIHNSIAKDKQHKLECEAKQLDFEPKCSYFTECDFLEAHQAPFKCPYCSEILMTYTTFQIHKSEHDGSLPFICQECGTGFKSRGNYTLHVKRHLRVFRFRCEICDKGYPINYELEMHMRSHTGVLPYLCSVCGEGFRTANIYDNHMRRHEERFRYCCHICKKGFNILVTLNDHVKAHLNVRDVICTICGKGFTSRKYLNYHKRIHGTKNYTCNICGKSYAQDAGLRQHRKSHGAPIGIRNK